MNRLSIYFSRHRETLAVTIAGMGVLSACLTFLGLVAAHYHTTGNPSTEALLVLTSTSWQPDILWTLVRVVASSALLSIGSHFYEKEKKRRFEEEVEARFGKEVLQ